MYHITKIDLAALKAATYISVYVRDGESRVRVCKEFKKTEKNPFEHTGEHLIAAPVTVDGASYGDASARCYGSMSMYQDSHIVAVISTLRVGDGVEFRFYPDAHTTENLRTHGMHGDVLYLIVTRGKHRYTFEIDHVTCPDNTARMCQNVNPRYSLAS